MKYTRLIKLTAFSYENEDAQSILEAFLRFFPFNLEENKVFLKKTEASGSNESKITIFEAEIKKDSLVKQFLESILENMGRTQKEIVIAQSESRLDKTLDFFLRFEKERWIKEKKLELTDSGKCFHLRMSIAAFPKKREIALKLIKDIFSR